MQGDCDGWWDKVFNQLLHLFRSSRIQRRKVRAGNLRIRDHDDLGKVVHIRISLHFHDAHYFFAALGRERNRHSPTQFLEVFPVIYLGLINNESIPIAVFFAWPARIARLIGRGFGGASFNRRCKKRRDHEYTLEQRSATQFHSGGVGSLSS